MDQARYEELKHKRRTDGLNDDEANELGRMMAERAGKPYSNAGERDAMPDDEERLAG